MDAKRDAFLLENEDWIKFLNDRETWKDKKEIAITSKDVILLDDEENAALKSWNRENRDLLQPHKPGRPEKYLTHRELIICCANFMYENLKNISHGIQDQLEIVDSFGIDDATAILNGTKMIVTSTGIYWDYQKPIIYKIPNYNYSLRSYLPKLAEHLHPFLEYIHIVIKQGLKDKAKLGIYKIGVCPYKKLKDKSECGLVFVGKKWDQQAFEAHAQKWQTMKHKRQKATWG